MRDALAENALRIGLFRFTIAPLQPLEVPAVNKGNMLRGGFGHAFRRLCCIPQCKDARACPLDGSCPYKAVFEPSPPPGADRLSKNQDIPRPFVFRAPPTRQTRFEKGERFEFGLVLIGRALDFLPYFVLSFRELAGQGLGLNRAVCELENVTACDFDAECCGQRVSIFRPNLSYSGASGPGGLDRAAHAATWPRRAITVRFLTPTHLTFEGQIVKRPEFHHLFKRVRDRVNALSSFYGDGPIDADFKGLGERAEKVRTVASRIEWVERFRTSSKTHQRHELSGFVGECTYEFPVSTSLKFQISNCWNGWSCGELLHVGKHAAWGNGWYEMHQVG